MRPSLLQWIPLAPCATSANPTVAPTMLWVADTGSLSRVAQNIHVQEPVENIQV